MSKFTEEWQRVRKDLGHMVGVMESMAVKYGECTNLEETYYNKGLMKGREEGLKRIKADICSECNHKTLAENSRKYADVLNIFDKLEAYQQMLISDIILEIVKENGGR